MNRRKKKVAISEHFSTEEDEAMKKTIIDLGGEWVEKVLHCDVLIAKDVLVSPKYREASNMFVPIVNRKWLEISSENKNFCEPTLFLLRSLEGCKIAVSGLPKKQRDLIRKQCGQEGAIFHRSPQEKTTHLITIDKMAYRKNENFFFDVFDKSIHIVRFAWYLDSTKNKMCLDEDRFRPELYEKYEERYIMKRKRQSQKLKRKKKKKRTSQDSNNVSSSSFSSESSLSSQNEIEILPNNQIETVCFDKLNDDDIEMDTNNQNKKDNIEELTGNVEDEKDEDEDEFSQLFDEDEDPVVDDIQEEPYPWFLRGCWVYLCGFPSDSIIAREAVDIARTVGALTQLSNKNVSKVPVHKSQWNMITHFVVYYPNEMELKLIKEFKNTFMHINIVTYEWLKDSFKNRSYLEEELYLWKGINPTITKNSNSIICSPKIMGEGIFNEKENEKEKEKEKEEVDNKNESKEEKRGKKKIFLGKKFCFRFEENMLLKKKIIMHGGYVVPRGNEYDLIIYPNRIMFPQEIDKDDLEQKKVVSFNYIEFCVGYSIFVPNLCRDDTKFLFLPIFVEKLGRSINISTTRIVRMGHLVVQNMISVFGCDYCGKISNKSDVLVAYKTSKLNSDMKKANLLNIPILNYTWLFDSTNKGELLPYDGYYHRENQWKSSSKENVENQKNMETEKNLLTSVPVQEIPPTEENIQEKINLLIPNSQIENPFGSGNEQLTQFPVVGTQAFDRDKVEILNDNFFQKKSPVKPPIQVSQVKPFQKVKKDEFGKGKNFLCLGGNDDEVEEAISMIEPIVNKLGGRLLRTFNDQVTHIIVCNTQIRNNKSNKFIILCALARGLWILREEYLIKSDTNRDFLIEENFLCSLYKDQARRKRFKNWKVFVYSESNENKRMIPKILNFGGAEILKTFTDECTHVIVSKKGKLNLEIISQCKNMKTKIVYDTFISDYLLSQSDCIEEKYIVKEKDLENRSRKKTSSKRNRDTPSREYKMKNFRKKKKRKKFHHKLM